MIDSREVKELKRKELLSLLPQDFKFKTEPWDFQLAAFVVGIAHTGYNFWLDLGLGKSKVAIDLVRFIATYKNPKVKALVCCINDAAIGNWTEQIKLHSDLPSVELHGSLDEKLGTYRSLDYGFFIIHYPGLRVMYADMMRDGYGKGKRCISALRVRKFGGFDVVIADESHNLKNKSTLVWRIVQRLVGSKTCSACYLLTGTPFGKTLIDIWAQYRLIDGGETFGSGVTEFKGAYCEQDFWGTWHVSKEGEKAIRERMFQRAIRYEEKDAHDLPPRRDIELHFDLSDEQINDYDKCLKAVPIKIKRGLFKELQNITMYARQICSGFLASADANEKRHVKYYKYNPKLEELLLPLLESVVDSTKVVIFHDFVIEGRMIEQCLRKLKIGYASLRGEIKDKYEQYKKFRQDDKVRVLIAHPQSGGSSLEFVVATYCIFYSNAYGVIARRQAEKRVRRPGQKHKQFFYDLLANGTVEISLLQRLQSQKDFFYKIVDGKQLLRMLRGLS